MSFLGIAAWYASNAEEEEKGIDTSSLSDSGSDARSNVCSNDIVRQVKVPYTETMEKNGEKTLLVNEETSTKRGRDDFENGSVPWYHENRGTKKSRDRHGAKEATRDEEMDEEPAANKNIIEQVYCSEHVDEKVSTGDKGTDQKKTKIRRWFFSCFPCRDDEPNKKLPKESICKDGTPPLVPSMNSPSEKPRKKRRVKFVLRKNPEASNSNSNLFSFFLQDFGDCVYFFSLLAEDMREESLKCTGGNIGESDNTTMEKKEQS